MCVCVCVCVCTCICTCSLVPIDSTLSKWSGNKTSEHVHVLCVCMLHRFVYVVCTLMSAYSLPCFIQGYVVLLLIVHSLNNLNVRSVLAAA